MKTPKLRCWDTELKEWNTSLIIQPDAVYRNMSDFREGKHTDKLEFDRYTGRIDHHESEIYEFDVLEVSGTVMTVVWDDGNLQWIVKNDLKMPIIRVPYNEKRGDCELWYALDDGDTVKKIGNIRDNPELVK